MIRRSQNSRWERLGDMEVNGRDTVGWSRQALRRRKNGYESRAYVLAAWSGGQSAKL